MRKLLEICDDTLSTLRTRIIQSIPTRCASLLGPQTNKPLTSGDLQELCSRTDCKVNYQGTFSFVEAACLVKIDPNESIIPNCILSTQITMTPSTTTIVEANIPREQNTTHETSSSTAIIVAIFCTIGVVGLVALFIFIRKRDSKEKNQNHYTTMEEASTRKPTAGDIQRIPCPTFSGELDLRDLPDFKLPYDEVELKRPLAQGSFGEVWLGVYHGRKIAVKKLKSAQSPQEVQYFIWEIFLLSKIYCPYVVQFLGVTWLDSPSGIMLVTEYMDGGDLRSVLEKNFKQKTLPWGMKLEIALSIAEGLVYLHSLDSKVIHRDLKSRNVMLDSKCGAKITDFGVARESSDATMTAAIGTYRWMAPEVLNSGYYSESADIFSFGVILSELSTDILPYSDLTIENRTCSDAAIISKVLAGEMLPTFASDCPLWYASLGKRCLSFDPNIRPAATRVAFELRQGLRVEVDCESGFV